MVFFEQAEGNGHEQTKYHLWDYAKKKSSSICDVVIDM